MTTATRLAAAALALIAPFVSFSQKGIAGMINAERAFSSYTASHNIRDGFLAYMDTGGIVFRQGKPVNAIESFRRQQPGKDILTWQPAFAVISGSGDLGATSGPYELHSGNPSDTVVHRGTFSSVWKLNSNGEWKNVLDLGVGNRNAYSAADLQEITLHGRGAGAVMPADEVLQVDRQFNKAIEEKISGALTTILAADSWLNMEGESPFRGVTMITNLLLNVPPAVTMSSENGMMAASRDFAYVWGTVNNGNRKENYLRVWIRRNRRWQVILQTIKW